MTNNTSAKSDIQKNGLLTNMNRACILKKLLLQLIIKFQIMFLQNLFNDQIIQAFVKHISIRSNINKQNKIYDYDNSINPSSFETLVWDSRIY
ncbi:unnamed protein product [Paramecium pentaurelia]|uniref:Uncharacterized protein n=1 Tax=Paramecium pentaurelia TaxID=43138 RepID=A0A8S1TI46_9CILI|nr:unnamed protein product [Paramecium pentaurelia]